MESVEQVKELIARGLCSPLSGDQYQRKRTWVIKGLEERIGHQINFSKTALRPVHDDWAVFYGEVASLKGITQKEGKDDYCLLYPDPESNTLFIAKEMLQGLPNDLVIDFFLYELILRNQPPSEKYTRNSPLDKKVRGFLRTRVIPYSVQGLTLSIFNYVVDIDKYEGVNNIPLDKAKEHHQNIKKELGQTMSISQEAVRGFTNFFRDQSRRTPEIIAQELGKIYVWSSDTSSRLKKMRLDLLEKGFEAIEDDLGVFSIVAKHLLEYCPLDPFIQQESRDFYRELESYS